MKSICSKFLFIFCRYRIKYELCILCYVEIVYLWEQAWFETQVDRKGINFNRNWEGCMLLDFPGIYWNCYSNEFWGLMRVGILNKKLYSLIQNFSSIIIPNYICVFSAYVKQFLTISFIINTLSLLLSNYLKTLIKYLTHASIGQEIIQ